MGCGVSKAVAAGPAPTPVCATERRGLANTGSDTPNAPMRVAAHSIDGTHTKRDCEAGNSTPSDTASNAAFVTVCAVGDAKGAKTMLAAHVDPNGVSNNKMRRTGLFEAAHFGHDTVAALLLTHPDIDVNKVDYLGKTPLSIAAQADRPSVMQLLLTHPDVDVNVGHIGEVSKAQANISPLWTSSEHGHHECVKLLLSHPKTDVNMTRSSGTSPLWIACQNGHIGTTTQLLT